MTCILSPIKTPGIVGGMSSASRVTSISSDFANLAHQVLDEFSQYVAELDMENVTTQILSVPRHLHHHRNATKKSQFWQFLNSGGQRYV